MAPRRQQWRPVNDLANFNPSTAEYCSGPASVESHFNCRQRHQNRDPEMVSNRFRTPREQIPALQNVQLEDHQIFDYDQQDVHRSRTIGDRAEIVQSQKPLPSNPQLMEQIYQFCLREIGKLRAVPLWMKDAVLFPLGPNHIRKIQNEGLNFPGYRYEFFISNVTSISVAVIETKGDRDAALSALKTALGPSEVENEKVLISEPSSGYGIQLNYGNKSEFVVDGKHSPFVLIFDSLYTSNERVSPTKFYSRILKCKIVSTRRITDPEMRWIEEKIKKPIRYRKMRLIEFQSPKEKNWAMSLGLVEYLDMFYCDGSFNYQGIHNSLHLQLDMKVVQQQRDCVSFTLRHEIDKFFAERTFQQHGLKIYYVDIDYKEKYELRFDANVKRFIISNFPRHMYTDEMRLEFVKQIADVNKIEYENIGIFVEPLDDSKKSLARAKTKDLARVIDYEFYRIGHVNRIYTPIDEPWLPERNGQIGAHEFLDLVKKRRDVPWRVHRAESGALKENEKFTVHFKTVPLGLAFIGPFLKESYIRSVCQIDENDQYGPKITPCYRRSFAISRSIRHAMDHEIRKLDRQMRETFFVLLKNKDPMMEEEEAMFYGIKIYDEWYNGSDYGIIGVMGWNVGMIDHFFNQLVKLFSPKIFKANEKCPELMYGIGEVYVRHLVKKYDHRLVVDIDKFKGEIKLIGDASEAAMKDLNNFSENRKSIQIRCEFPLYYPYFNRRMYSILSYPYLIEDLQYALGAHSLVLDRNYLDFEGTIEVYEKLNNILESLNDAIFKKEMNFIGGGEEYVNSVCPTCWTEIGLSTDYYRFHCGHVMCRLCVNNKIENIKQTDEIVACEHSGCNSFVAPSEILHVTLGGSNRLRDFDSDKLRPFMNTTKKMIFNSSNEINHCPTINCPGLLTKSEGPLDEYPKCVSCEREYCRKCLAEPHTDTSCEEFGRLREPENSLEAYVKAVGSDQIKKCPNCAVYVEKSIGCNHIECACGTHFCWKCLFTSNCSQKIYAHMTEVHGGSGVEDVNPADFEEADPEVRHLLAEQFLDGRGNAEELIRIQHRIEGPEDNDQETEEPEHLNQEHRNNRQVYQNRGRPQGRGGFRVMPRAPIMPQREAPPPAPVRARRLLEIPAEVLAAAPETASEPEIYLEFLNSVRTLQEQEHRIRQLIQNIGSNR